MLAAYFQRHYGTTTKASSARETIKETASVGSSAPVSVTPGPKDSGNGNKKTVTVVFGILNV